MKKERNKQAKKIRRRNLLFWRFLFLLLIHIEKKQNRKKTICLFMMFCFSSGEDNYQSKINSFSNQLDEQFFRVEDFLGHECIRPERRTLFQIETIVTDVAVSII